MVDFPAAGAGVDQGGNVVRLAVENPACLLRREADRQACR